jgi:hypothetical protein
LFFSCALKIGCSFCYDCPGPLEKLVKENEFKGMSSTVYNYQYTIYAYPNIILPFFGGVFMDLLGMRLALIVFSLLVVLG